MQLFELTPDKIEIPLLLNRPSGSIRLTHHIRPPKEAEWINYDRALSIAIEDVKGVDGGTRVLDESMIAACALYDAISLGASGYAVEYLNLCNGNRERIPPAHKRTVIQALLMVTRTNSDMAENPLDHLDLSVDEDVITLTAIRGSQYPSLVHRFKSASPAQHIQYERIRSDSVIMRGTKTGVDRVLLPSRLKKMIDLYNELILTVEGYSVDGIGIGSGQQAIQYVDAHHKRVAVEALFETDQVELAEPS